MGVMKTLIKILFFILFLFSTAVFGQERGLKKIDQQNFTAINFADSSVKIGIKKTTNSFSSTSAVFSQVETINDWLYLGLFGTPDSTKIKSVMGQDDRNYQTFGTFGFTMTLNGIPFIQSDWVKGFWSSYPVLPDTIAVDVKIISMTSNVKEVGMKIPVQDSVWWSSGPVQYLDLSVSGWQTFKVDMSYQKGFMSHLGKIYLSFQPVAQDSSYIGADIAVSNLRGIDDTLGVVVYDNFTLVGISDIRQIPSEFVLEQNYPNPFNPSTTIKFTVPKREYVNLTVFNLLGQKVETLISEEKNKGSYEVRFNASNLPSGVYFYRIRAGNSVKTKKMTLLR